MAAASEEGVANKIGAEGGQREGEPVGGLAQGVGDLVTDPNPQSWG